MDMKKRAVHMVSGGAPVCVVMGPSVRLEQFGKENEFGG